MKKQTILAVVFVAIGLLAMGAAGVAMAADTFTINATEQAGLQGTRFVPSVFFGIGTDGTLGTADDAPCSARPGHETGDTGVNAVGGTGAPTFADDPRDGDCTAWGNEVINAWFTGGYFEPRGGTSIIPPSGDHHRSGYRAMMQPSFNAGAWLTGFAPFLNQFPNFPQVGTPGPGGGDLAAQQDLLLLFLDHHGEPLTPGRFPRYIPHERQAWADTLMVKYVASVEGGGSGFTQSLRSQVGQSRIDRTWSSMSDESANGCPGGWCDWSFSVGADGAAGTADDTLTRTYRVTLAGADGTSGTSDDFAGPGPDGTVGGVGSADDVPLEFTVFGSGLDGTAGTFDDGGNQSLRIDSFRGRATPGADGTLGTSDDGGNDGVVDLIKTLKPIEIVPSVIDDRLMQADTDLAGCGSASGAAADPLFGGAVSAGNPCDRSALPAGTDPGPDGTLGGAGSADDFPVDRHGLFVGHNNERDQADQSLRYQIQIVSGPNFHAEEGSDPYTWVICGSRTGGRGEHDCDTGTSDIIGETNRYAFRGGAVYDQSERFGADGRFFTADDGAGTDGTTGTSDDTLVICNGVNAATTEGVSGTPRWGADCDSNPGPDLVYGTEDDGLIYYAEAIEDGFRSGTRENRAFAFSFIDAQASLRQLMTQSVEGFLASCLNCNSPAGEHATFAAPGPLNYDWAFPGTLATQPDDHPPGPSGSIPVFLP